MIGVPSIPAEIHKGTTLRIFFNGLVLVDAYPSAGSRPVALDGPAVGGDRAISATVGVDPKSEVASASTKINIIAEK